MYVSKHFSFSMFFPLTRAKQRGANFKRGQQCPYTVIISQMMIGMNILNNHLSKIFAAFALFVQKPPSVLVIQSSVFLLASPQCYCHFLCVFLVGFYHFQRALYQRLLFLEVETALLKEKHFFLVKTSTSYGKKCLFSIKCISNACKFCNGKPYNLLGVYVLYHQSTSFHCQGQL